MNILEANKAVFRRALDFTGRSSRSEFWWSLLTVWLLGYLLLLPLIKAGPQWAITVSMLVVAVYALPMLAVSFRRLQDTSISGMWMMLFFAAWIAGGLIQAFIWLVYLGLMCVASTDGRNEYGPSPVEPPEEDADEALSEEAPLEAATAVMQPDEAAADDAPVTAEPAMAAVPKRTLGYTFNHLTDFSGRSPRHEFITFFLVVLWGYLGLVALAVNAPTEAAMVLIYGYHGLVLLTSLALQVRRLHDMNLSGLWLLPNFSPLVFPLLPFIGQWLDADFWAGALSLLYTACFAFMAGTEGRNRFGADPLNGNPSGGEL